MFVKVSKVEFAFFLKYGHLQVYPGKLQTGLQGVARPRSQCNASSSPRRLRLVNYYQMQPKTPCKLIMTAPISAGYHQVAMHSRLRDPLQVVVVRSDFSG